MTIPLFSFSHLLVPSPRFFLIFFFFFTLHSLYYSTRIYLFLFADGTTTISTATTSNTKTFTTVTTTTSTANTTTFTSTTTATAASTNDTVFTAEVPVFAAVTDTTTHVAATASSVGSCDLDTSVDEISVENVPRREEGFFHRLLSRRSTKKKAAAKSASAEDVDVDRFLFDEATGARPRQREEPPPAGRMQLSYPPDLPPDHRPQEHYHRVPAPSAVAEDVFEPDTFAPIKHSFSLGQATTDDEATSSGDGGSSSVQKSSSSDSVSSAALDESADSTAVAAAAVSSTDQRHRSYSSSDSEHQAGGQHQQHLRPVPAPRPSKLYNGAGGTAADVVVRRKKRDDHQQQPELLKVFARRSLKLGKDGEPEFLLLAAAEVDGGDGDDKATPSNGEWPVEQQVVASEDRVVVVVVDDDDNRQAVEHVMVDVNENQTVQAAAAVEVVPRFKRIQQRREEWEKRLLQQQRN